MNSPDFTVALIFYIVNWILRSPICILKPLVFGLKWINLQLYTAAGDRKSELRIFFQPFMLNMSAPYYAVLLFKFDLTQNMAYSTKNISTSQKEKGKVTWCKGT